MLGREAYHNPFVMANFDQRYYGDSSAPKTREQVLEAMIPYIQAELARYGALGLKLNSITRHMLGLMTGLPGARAFRQVLSDSKKLAAGDANLLLEAAARLRIAA
jgi:tRNA-dihydrouridine synthase A